MTLLTFAALGAAGVQIGRMPPMPAPTVLSIRAAALKAEFASYLGTILPEGDELSVLKALAIGERGDLSSSLKRAYRVSGAMHLLALSGLHVGVIYAMLSRLLSPLGGHRAARMVRTLSILAFLWLFAMVSGLSASIFRAVLMITLYEISTYLSGDKDGLAAVAGSALVIMLVSPEAPRDIGFQLSYSAVLSIHTIYPRLKALLRTRFKPLGYIWSLLCISISCQATCGVVAWLYFGTFPRFFLVTTLLAIPLATVVVYAIAAALVTSFIPSAAPITAMFLRQAIGLLNRVVAVIASL